MRQKEVDALWWLYEHTAGKNWKDNSGWAGPSTDPCRRFSTERRWALTQISGLRAVREFRLSDNKISGALPTEVGELRHPLEYLDVYNNPLSGTMPPTIFELINLKYLYVPNAILDPILNYKCQERIPRNGKYNWRIVRDEYPVMMAKYCPEPYDVQFAFEPLQGDV